MSNNYITKIDISKYLNTNNLRVEISIDKKELDEQVRILREAMNHYGREHPEVSGVDIYNAFEEQIYNITERLVDAELINRFNQIPHQNFVPIQNLTPDDSIQDDMIDIICLHDGLYEWNEATATSTRRVRVRNGGPFEYGVIYSVPREDVRFEDGL